jgi:hypothetical protein
VPDPTVSKVARCSSQGLPPAFPYPQRTERIEMELASKSATGKLKEGSVAAAPAATSSGR